MVSYELATELNTAPTTQRQLIANVPCYTHNTAPLDSFSVSGIFSNPKCVIRDSASDFCDGGICWLARMEHEKQRYCSDSVAALRRGAARADIALHGILEAIAILLTML